MQLIVVSLLNLLTHLVEIGSKGVTAIGLRMNDIFVATQNSTCVSWCGVGISENDYLAWVRLACMVQDSTYKAKRESKIVRACLARDPSILKLD